MQEIYKVIQTENTVWFQELLITYRKNDFLCIINFFFHWGILWTYKYVAFNKDKHLYVRKALWNKICDFLFLFLILFIYLFLGNDKIYALTNQKPYSVRFDLKDVEQEKRYAVYDNFWIDDEDRKYTLHISLYSGDAGTVIHFIFNKFYLFDVTK